ILIHFWQGAVVFKFTNVVCESFNKSWIIINYCRLRALNRNKTVLNLNITVLHPCSNIWVDIQIFKRANGYKPWLVNTSLDVCKFHQKPYNPWAILIYKQVKNFTNINHTCPYVGDQIVKGFYLRPEILRLPFPSGDYLLALTWIVDNKSLFITNEYFTFTEDLI
ncbi:hypothetical protein KR093_004064, partial [Drosophila rubida]